MKNLNKKKFHEDKTVYIDYTIHTLKQNKKDFIIDLPNW